MLSISSLKEQLCDKIKVEPSENSNSPVSSPHKDPDLVPPVDSTATTCRLLSVDSLKQQLSGKMHFDPPIMQPTVAAPLPMSTSALLDLAIASLETSVNLQRDSSNFPEASISDGSGPSNCHGYSAVGFSNIEPGSSENQNPNATSLVKATENAPTVPLDMASQLAVTKSSPGLASKSEDTLLRDLEIIFESVGGHQNVELIMPPQSEVSASTSSLADDLASRSLDLPLVQLKGDTTLAEAFIGNSIDKNLNSDKSCSGSRENIPNTSSSLNYISEEKSMPVVSEGPISNTIIGAVETFSILPNKCLVSAECVLKSSSRPTPATKLSIGSCSAPPIEVVDIIKTDLTKPQVKTPLAKPSSKLGSSSPIEIVEMSETESASSKDKFPTTANICIESSPLTQVELVDSSQPVSTAPSAKSPAVKLPSTDSALLSPIKPLEIPETESTCVKGTSLSPGTEGSNLLDFPSTRKTLPKRLQTPRKSPRSPIKTYPIRSLSKKTVLLKVCIPSPTSQDKESPVTPKMVSCSSKVNPLILLCKEQLNEKLSLTCNSDLIPVPSAIQSSSAVISPDVIETDASNETDVAVSSEEIVHLALPTSHASIRCLETQVEQSTAEVKLSTSSSSTALSPCDEVGEPVTKATEERWSPDDAALQDAIRVLADWSSDALRDRYASQVKLESGEKASDWTCGECSETFGKVSQLKIHLQKHEERNAPKPHTCVRCRKSFRYSIALKRHACTASNSDSGQPRFSANTLGWPYFCNDCNFGFLKKFDFWRHQMGVHGALSKKIDKISRSETPAYGNPTNWPYFCAVCNVGFIKQLDYVQHKLSHSSDAEAEAQLLVCNVCDKQFSNRTQLSGHMNLHSGLDCYMCRYCCLMFARKSMWQEHELCHSGEMPLNCQFCGKRFKKKSSLHYHELNHMGAKRYSCPYCDKSFVHRWSLRLHISAHKNTKPFECEICKMGFTKKVNLKSPVLQHMYFNHHHCLKCDGLFTTPEKLNDHMRTEHGEFDTDDSEIDENDDLEKSTDSSVDINLGVTITELKQKVRTLMLAGNAGGSTALRSLDLAKQEVEKKMTTSLRQKLKGIMSENRDIPVKKIKK